MNIPILFKIRHSFFFHGMAMAMEATSM